MKSIKVKYKYTKDEEINYVQVGRSHHKGHEYYHKEDAIVKRSHPGWIINYT